MDVVVTGGWVVVGGRELLSVDSLVVSKDDEVPEQVKTEHLVLV